LLNLLNFAQTSGFIKGSEFCLTSRKGCVHLAENCKCSRSLDVDRWPAIRHAVELTGTGTEEDIAKCDRFLEDLSALLDRMQGTFCSLAEDEREKCGQNGIAADIAFNVDMEKKEILLDRIYKYCNIENHLFKELAEILRQNFPEFTLIVPARKGYQLAEEIHRYLGGAKIKWIHLKSRADERLLMGDHLDDMGITFEGILRDTERHYAKRGGMEKAKMETRSGFEISMYHRGEEGEEEVLWMLARAPLSGVYIAN
jgi:hypothetical protein